MTLLERRRLLLSQNKSLLPSEYQLLEYIQNDSPVYIDTGITIDPNLTIEVKAQLVHVNTASQSVWGGRANTIQGLQLSYVKSVGLFQFMHGSAVTHATFPWDYDIHIFKGDKNYIYMDGVLKNTALDNLPPSFYTIYLFATNTAGTPGFSGGSLKMYYCKIWNENKLLCDFIPCQNSDGTYGMYDLVRKIFCPMVDI